MKKNLILISIITIITLFAMVMFVGEILNPHSFLDSLGAAIRVVIIVILTTMWIKWCPKKYIKLKRYGIILFMIFIFIYVWAGISLYMEDFRYR